MKFIRVFVLAAVLGLCLCVFIYNTSIIKWISSNNREFLSVKYDPSRDMNIVTFVQSKNHNFMKGVLKFQGKKFDIFIHGRKDLISNYILDHSTWESGWLDQFVKYMTKNPGIQVIDVGCNIGVYTMIAASFGYKVIAIDANKNNTDRLSQSILRAKFMNRVTILLNAVSNERKSFSMHFVPSNIGGQALLENKNSTYQVKSIFLNDLLPLIDINEAVMMKIDIEGHEIKAIQAASTLFEKINIKVIFMEWFNLKLSPDSYILMNFFLSRNYRPYPDFFSQKQLSISNYDGWPFEMVWRKV